MITVGEQVADMASVFPSWSCERLTGRTAVWVGQLQPHKTSYAVRIEYTEPLLPEGRSTLYVQPLVEILGRQLERRFGNAEGSLPHVYVAHPRTNRLGPFLCLFDDKDSQWTPNDLISNTTVPWASNWLSCYESWLATGKWFGTGKHIQTQPNGRSAISALMEHYHATTSIAALAGYTAPTS